MIEYLLYTYTLLTIPGGYHEALRMATTPQESTSIARATLIPSQGAPISCFTGVRQTSETQKTYDRTIQPWNDQNSKIRRQNSQGDTSVESTSAFDQQEIESGPETGPDLSTPRYPSKQSQKNNMRSPVQPAPHSLSKQNSRDRSSQIPRQWWYLQQNP